MQNPPLQPQYQGDVMQSIVEWFAFEAKAAGESCAEKAVERGAYDLYLLGRTMAGFLGVTTTEDDRFYLLIGILFYAEGKIARALSALKEGRLPNVDDWHDLSIYGRMARYVTERGSWP